MFTTSSGLQIAYLGGAYDKKNFAVPGGESGRGGSNLVRTIFIENMILSVWFCN